jgi:C_GCAxxG_C_C family probable redox protein
MRDDSRIENDDILWAGTNFYGGIMRHREGVCGSVSAMAMYLGYLYRVPPGDKEKAAKAIEAARAKTNQYVQEFKDRFGSIVCIKLLGIENYTEEETRRFFVEKKYEKQCNEYVRWVVEKLFGLER